MTYLLRIRCSNEEDPITKDVSKLLYDLVLTHDYGVLTEDDINFVPPPFFWRHNGRRVSSQNQLRTARIVKESPLIVELAIISIPALWTLMQVIDKAMNWRLNREKLELEVEKLRHEKYGNLSAEVGGPMDRIRSEQQRDQTDKFAKRLGNNSITIADWELVPKDEERAES